jgi:hypothetical protein
MGQAIALEKRLLPVYTLTALAVAIIVTLLQAVPTDAGDAVNFPFIPLVLFERSSTQGIQQEPQHDIRLKQLGSTDRVLFQPA